MSVHHSTYPLCRHTKTNGRRCQAPALVTSAYCRSHRKLHRTRPRTIDAGPGLSTNVLHPLRTADDIQQALGMVINALAAGRIHPRIAGRMFYGLQVARSVLNKSQ